jgi:hypothetical protein
MVAGFIKVCRKIFSLEISLPNFLVFGIEDLSVFSRLYSVVVWWYSDGIIDLTPVSFFPENFSPTFLYPTLLVVCSLVVGCGLSVY